MLEAMKTTDISHLSTATLRDAHSVCFRYQPGVVDKISPHAAILVTNAVTLPALWKDNSVEQVQETIHRKTMHAEALRKNPGVFKKKYGESAEQIKRQHMTRDLLSGIHIVADPNDIVNHNYTYSRRKQSNSTDLLTNIEDFLQPEDPIRLRSTGYSGGLLRSMISFDTFGPNHSMATEKKRENGELPPAPNDRNRHLRTDLIQKGLVTTSGSSSRSSPPTSPFSPFNSEYQVDAHFIEMADPRSKSGHWHQVYMEKKLEKQLKNERKTQLEQASLLSLKEAIEFENTVSLFEDKLRMKKQDKVGWT